MKKALLTVLACTSIGLTTKAQLPAGSVAPNFTLADINGVTHNLYTYLDSGYTVILDISAAWCGPCWSAKQSGVFNTLTANYGPNGAITPKKIKFIFVEGESQNTINQLHNVNSTGGNGANPSTDSQGDWVTGALYPIIDNSSLNSLYQLTGFPAFTVIGRDRLVAATRAGWGSSMATESYWLNLIDTYTPNYPPSATLDAKAVPYFGKSNFLCSANPAVQFQNYADVITGSEITAASVQILNGSGTPIATQNWTGSLLPMNIVTVFFPAFTPSTPGPYSFKVNVVNDTYPANDQSANNVFNVLNTTNTNPLPYSQNFESATAMPAKFYTEGEPGGIFFYRSGVPPNPNIIGANGSMTNCIVVDYYGMQNSVIAELYLGNYDNTAFANSSLKFNLAQAQFDNTTNDKLELMVSTNCGTTWNTIWSKSGAALATIPNTVGTGQFIPNSASQWRTEVASFGSHISDNLFVKFRATSGYGNLGFIDDIQLINTTSVADVISEESISIYPNPASTEVKVSFMVSKATDVQIQVIDMMGRVLQTIDGGQLTTGNHTLTINTQNLASGIYNVKILTAGGNHTERLTVVR